MQINHVGVSGGKDSTALLLWAVHESGYPRESLRASFADTGNELDVTYDYVRMLGETVFPITWLKPERDFYELAKHKKRFPSTRARFCTTELKMEPSRKHVHALMDEGHEVLLHTGVRGDESESRGHLQERDFDNWYGLPVYRPLLRWTIDDVWAIHARYNVPRNPLYAMGMRRVGCAPCIMSRKDEIRRIANLFPERIDLIRQAEQDAHGSNLIATFFARDKVPELQRNFPITTAAGELMQVATIDDVVRWSRTGRGGLTGDLFADLDDDEAQACWHHSGLCE
jgi:3'-phosphoadenosine 5'-phosphosulfate sulfotransferase (PAPS reductase)/FAD synthetase